MITFSKWKFVGKAPNRVLMSEATLEREGRTVKVPVCMALTDITNNNPEGIKWLMDALVEGATESAENLWRQTGRCE